MSKRPDLRVVHAHQPPMLRNVINLSEHRTRTKPVPAPRLVAEPCGTTWCDLVLRLEPRPSRRKIEEVEEQ